MLITIGAVLVYEWVVIRAALQTSGGVAAGFVAADLALTFIVTQLTAAALAV